MLSGESAMGKYPEEAVAMLAKIAAFTEAHRPPTRLNDLKAVFRQRRPATAAEAIATVVEHALETVPCAAVFVPTRTGATARMISRFNPPVWIVLSRDAGVCRDWSLYGVHAVQLAGSGQTGATLPGIGLANIRCPVPRWVTVRPPAAGRQPASVLVAGKQEEMS
jgi:pyruvate kinase